MLQDKTLRLRVQLSILRDVQKKFPGRTIENIIQNLEAILDYHTKNQNQNDITRVSGTGNDDVPRQVRGKIDGSGDDR